MPLQTWEVLETEMLDGQKLQGTLTAKEVYEVLRRREVRRLCVVAGSSCHARVVCPPVHALPQCRSFDVVLRDPLCA